MKKETASRLYLLFLNIYITAGILLFLPKMDFQTFCMVLIYILTFVYLIIPINPDICWDYFADDSFSKEKKRNEELLDIIEEQVKKADRGQR